MRVISKTRPPGSLRTVVSTSGGRSVVHIRWTARWPPETATVTSNARMMRVVVKLRFSCAQYASCAGRRSRLPSAGQPAGSHCVPGWHGLGGGGGAVAADGSGRSAAPTRKRTRSGGHGREPRAALRCRGRACGVRPGWCRGRATRTAMVAEASTRRPRGTPISRSRARPADSAAAPPRRRVRGWPGAARPAGVRRRSGGRMALMRRSPAHACVPARAARRSATRRPVPGRVLGGEAVHRVAPRLWPAVPAAFGRWGA